MWHVPVVFEIHTSLLCSSSVFLLTFWINITLYNSMWRLELFGSYRLYKQCRLVPRPPSCNTQQNSLSDWDYYTLTSMKRTVLSCILTCILCCLLSCILIGPENVHKQLHPVWTQWLDISPYDFFAVGQFFVFFSSCGYFTIEYIGVNTFSWAL